MLQSSIFSFYDLKDSIIFPYFDQFIPFSTILAHFWQVFYFFFLFQINGHDVRQASHETVVTLIRKSGDLVQLNVVSVSYDQSVAAQLSLPPTPNNNQNHR